MFLWTHMLLQMTGPVVTFIIIIVWSKDMCLLCRWD